MIVCLSFLSGNAHCILVLEYIISDGTDVEYWYLYPVLGLILVHYRYYTAPIEQEMCPAIYLIRADQIVIQHSGHFVKIR
jgi:hypothetical protein